MSANEVPFAAAASACRDRASALRLGAPEDMLTMSTHTAYDPEADTAPWVDFICDLFLLKSPDGSWNEEKGG